MVLPLFTAVVPTPHEEQFVEAGPEIVPGGQRNAALSGVQYDPAAQALHTDEEAVLTHPTGQEVHTEEPFVLKVPAGHAVTTPLGVHALPDGQRTRVR